MTTHDSNISQEQVTALAVTALRMVITVWAPSLPEPFLAQLRVISEGPTPATPREQQEAIAVAFVDWSRTCTCAEIEVLDDCADAIHTLDKLFQTLKMSGRTAHMLRHLSEGIDHDDSSR